MVIYLMLYSQASHCSAGLPLKSFRPRSLRTCPCNFFFFSRFAILPFPLHFFFTLTFLLSIAFPLFLQKQGGVGGFFPFRNYSPSHQSPTTARQSRWPSSVPLRYDAVLHRHNL